MVPPPRHGARASRRTRPYPPISPGLPLASQGNEPALWKANTPPRSSTDWPHARRCRLARWGAGRAARIRGASPVCGAIAPNGLPPTKE